MLTSEILKNDNPIPTHFQQICMHTEYTLTKYLQKVKHSKNNRLDHFLLKFRAAYPEEVQAS